MNVSLVTIGEPLPWGDGIADRPHRAGYLAQCLVDQGHSVTWWTSTFDHVRRKAVALDGDVVSPRPGLTLRFLSGGGYTRNVSLARIRDQRLIATKLRRGLAESTRPDVMVASWPPVELCSVCVAYGASEGVPVVLDIRDLWPDIFAEVAPPWARPLARLALAPLVAEARRTMRQATAITGITRPIVEWGLARAGRPWGSRDAAFPFGYDVVEPSPDRLARAEAFWDAQGIVDDGVPTICFFGNLGRQFDLAPVIDSARRLSAEGVRVRFALCGNGERLETYRQLAAGLPSVVLPGWVDAAGIYALLRRSYAGIDPLPDRFDFLASINNKAVEYLSAGVPVISSPPRGVLAETLRARNCGVSCEAGDAGELTAVIREACRDTAQWTEKARNARRFFDEELTMRHVYQAFVTHLDSLVLR